MTNTIDHLLEAYEIGVEDPEISGMEHLDMLLTRSKLAKVVDDLTPSQKARLTRADQELTRQAEQFYAAISRIANLKSWRDDEDAPPSHWWWYLDVLVEAPVQVAA